MTEGPYDCDARIQLRLAGLNGGLNFLLFRNQGCRVNVTIEQGSTTRVIAGIICNVGTNFVDIKQKADKVVTILQERIVHIEWLDRSIGSCTRSGHRACHYLDFEETEEE
ncbi:hypothetical protein J2T13_005078 [Paenibacillus sp. DS2015]|uniref:hypothetical protein n=1 Tax=Paenibacillus sp. DS2015 TaxID=3373917 RepID=UPI003D1CE790